jgi:Sec-independent protein translocase protein TatA
MEYFQVVVYVAALVWGASTMRAEIRYLREDLNSFKDEFKQSSRIFTDTLQDHGERIGKIEGKVL